MKWHRTFILSAGTILLMAALIRFFIACGNAQVLALPDPLLGIPLRFTVLLAGGLEMLVACVCLFGRNVRLQTGWLLWLAINYLVVQFGLIWMNVHPQGTGIGSLTDPLHLTRGWTGLLVMAVPVYLVVGSCVAAVWLWIASPIVARRQADQARQHKLSCPACGGHIQFRLENLGQRTLCPHCQSPVTLRKPENLKMPCYFCQQHIEFPAHAIGTKLPCPHCGKGITLMEPDRGGAQ